MIDYTMTQLVMALGGLGIASLLVLYVLGHLAKLVWVWIDRGESKIKHLFDSVLKPRILRVNDTENRTYYVSGKGSDGVLVTSWEKDNAMLFFSLKSAEKYRALADCPANIKIVEQEIAIILLGISVVAVLALTGIVALVVNFPTIMMFILGTVGTVLSARYLRDLQKGIIKIKDGLKAHMADTKAHTEGAKEIDVEFEVGLKD